MPRNDDILLDTTTLDAGPERADQSQDQVSPAPDPRYDEGEVSDPTPSPDPDDTTGADPEPAPTAVRSDDILLSAPVERAQESSTVDSHDPSSPEHEGGGHHGGDGDSEGDN